MKQNCCLLAGLSLLLLVWMVPLEGATGGYFSAHMLRHMTVVALATPLIVLGAPKLFTNIKVSPLLASVVEFLIVWGWHLPAFHDHARANPVMLASEQLSFLLAGLLLWASVLKPREALAGAGGLFLTSMHMTLLGAILILSPRLLYQAEICRLGGIPDQQMGGMIMLAIGTPVYLIASLVLLSRELRSSRNGELAP